MSGTLNPFDGASVGGTGDSVIALSPPTLTHAPFFPLPPPLSPFPFFVVLKARA